MKEKRTIEFNYDDIDNLIGSLDGKRTIEGINDAFITAKVTFDKKKVSDVAIAKAKKDLKIDAASFGVTWQDDHPEVPLILEVKG